MRVAALSAAIVLVNFVPSFASAQELKDKVKEAINGQGYSGVRIDDTRPAEQLGVRVGKSGVEYLLDNVKLEVSNVIVQRDDGAIFPKTTLRIRARMFGGEYKEKHFRGVGNEYHEEVKHSPEAEAEFIVTVDQEGARVVEVNKLGGGGRGKAYEMLVSGAKAKIVERIKQLN